jgi:hypothetical protein
MYSNKLNQIISNIIYRENQEALDSGYGVLCDATEYLAEKIANECCKDISIAIIHHMTWFDEIIDRLHNYPAENIWSNGDEILCKTEEVADALADMLECLYKAQGEDVLINTGYYDPIEDERNGEVDRYTGWWYVDIG